MIAQNVLLATLSLTCVVGCVWSYGSAGQGAMYEAVPSADDSAANSISDIAAAKASASRIRSVDLAALHQYGYQIGKPLLIKDFGLLTNLYSALAPKRSFVGTIDSGFYKDSHGKIKFRDESSVGAIVI